MTTKLIGMKEWRENMTKIWKKSKNKRVRYIVLNHSKPMFEVSPLHSDELELADGWDKKTYYAFAEKSFDFWKQEKDEGIFDESISL